MGDAEKKLATSEPIRKDIVRLRSQIEERMSLSKLSWQRGLGTTHLRGCLQGLLSLFNHHPDLAFILQGYYFFLYN